MGNGKVTLEIDGHVAVLTIDRPAKLNALTIEMLDQLREHSHAVETDPDVWVLVLTGAGDRSFCAGGDLQQLLPRIADDGDDSLLSPDPSQRFFSRVYKPIVAAVNGICIGGGLELLLGTDIRIASREAVFGLGEVKWGLIPAAGTHVRLPRQIPWAIAMELLLTGETISAERARECGLVNEVVEPAAVLDRALEVAGRIARNGPLAVRTAKRIAVDALALESGFRLESALNSVVLRSDDIREGLAAFAERRPPRYQGR